ncbi:MAG: VWA domain-containing protein [Planctomycetota bacterium]
MNRPIHSRLITFGFTGNPRRGAAHVMIALMLFVFAIMSAFMIDYAYMLLIRGQARMVADSAARAGAEALVRTRDPNTAIQTAIDIGGRNQVAGRAFLLSPGDVVLGQSVPAADGTWNFNAGVMPYNSVQVTSRVRRDAPFGAAPMFFGGVTGVDDFQTRGVATAGEQPIEICLCIDRSLSMIYRPVTGSRYPPGNDLLYPAIDYGYNADLRQRHSPPHRSDSRWAAIRSALNIFFTECGKAVNPPRVALVTFSSAGTQTEKPKYSYTTTDVDVQMPTGAGVTWSQNLTQLQGALDYRSFRPLFGFTQTSLGLQAAIDVCTGASGRVQAKKVIILMTDGVHDPGFSPLSVAANAVAANITVHCVSMLTTWQPDLNQVASMTGGKYYVTGTNTTTSGDAQNLAELQQAFRELANQIPIVLMD